MWNIESEDWGLPIRANLRLWPTPTDNMLRVLSFIGQPWDEEAIGAAIGGADPRRAVRQTFEVLARTGIALRNPSDGRFVLTKLGDSALRFIGVRGGKAFVNANNLHLLGAMFVPALSRVIEYQAIWSVMRRCGDRLTNEELNRVMARVRQPEDIEPCAEAVRESRLQEDLALIGPRIYEDNKFLSAPEDQRRAITPLFQRISAGGIILDLSGDERIIRPKLVPAIDAALRVQPSLHASTKATDVLAMSRASIGGGRG